MYRERKVLFTWWPTEATQEETGTQAVSSGGKGDLFTLLGQDCVDTCLYGNSPPTHTHTCCTNVVQNWDRKGTLLTSVSFLDTQLRISRRTILVLCLLGWLVGGLLAVSGGRHVKADFQKKIKHERRLLCLHPVLGGLVKPSLCYSSTRLQRSASSSRCFYMSASPS